MITSKQRAYLRGLANELDPIFQIGKGGITPNFVKQIFDTLEARELLKVNVLPNSEYTAREACGALCERVGANPVLVAGNKFVLYKRSREHKKIVLPGEPAQARPRSKPHSNSKNSSRNAANKGGTAGKRARDDFRGAGGVVQKREQNDLKSGFGKTGRKNGSIAKKGRGANGANRPVRRGF